MDNNKKQTSKVSKLDNLNKFLISENITQTRVQSLWKKEILKEFNSEKTGRRKLRTMQLNLSKHLLAMDKIKDINKRDKAKIALSDFYKTCLVDKSRFTNISREKSEYKIIEDAFNLVKNEI